MHSPSERMRRLRLLTIGVVLLVFWVWEFLEHFVLEASTGTAFLLGSSPW